MKERERGGEEDDANTTLRAIGWKTTRELEEIKKIIEGGAPIGNAVRTVEKIHLQFISKPSLSYYQH